MKYKSEYDFLEGEPIKRAHFDDAGIDFRSPIDFILTPAGTKYDQYVIDTGIHVQIPVGYFGKMESKSGLMVNHGVCCMGGVVDSGFRGTVKVRMINHGHEQYHFSVGDKLCQMVLIPTLLADLERVDELGESVSGRGDSGFGSTGK